jgi:hypothetical protein
LALREGQMALAWAIMISKDLAELRRLLLRYGHPDIASALEEITRGQENIKIFVNAEARIAAKQRVEIWQAARNSFIALGEHLATLRKAKFRTNTKDY